MSTLSKQVKERNVWAVPLAFAAIYIIWGTTYLAIRVAVETIPPFFMAGVRFVLAGLLALTFLWLRGVALPTRPQWRSAALIGLFLVVGGNGLVTWSEQKVPSGTAALVVATVPLWITVFDWLIYRRTRPTKRIVAGLILGTLGIAMLIGPTEGNGSAAIGPLDWLILLAAPILWSTGSLRSRQANLPANTFMGTAAEMLAGGLLLIGAGLITGEAGRLDLAAVSGLSFWAMLYLTVFGSIIAFTAYIWLLKHVEAPKVASYTYVNPTIAVLLGWLLLDETLTLQTLVAVAVIVTAVIFITTGRLKDPGRQPAPSALTQPAAGESAGD